MRPGTAEQERVYAVRDLGLLDTPEEQRFDRIVDLTRRIFGVSYAAVNLIDADRQWAKARSGLPFPQEVPREESFCSVAIEDRAPLVVPDAREDARFRDKGATTGEFGVRFYAGQPLVVDGEKVGALCLVDDAPRELTEDQVQLLEELGRWVESELTRSSEMRQAAEAQAMLLPSGSPDLPRLQVSGGCVQTQVVGGDFYDWYVSDGCLHVVLADVMGKGVSSAIHAASVRATLRTTGLFNALDVALHKSDVSIAQDMRGSGAFVTAFLARVSPEDGHVQYVDAGHGLGLVLDAAGQLHRLKDDQPPLGLGLGHDWQVQETYLQEGDTLVVVSDGFLDFFDTQEDVIRTTIEVGSRAGSAQQLVDDFIDFAVRHGPQDDVSVLAVRRTA